MIQQPPPKKSFVGTLANKGSLPVAIIHSVQNDKKCYFVILFKNQTSMDRVSKDAAQPHRIINLEDYGIIIAKGFGNNPSNQEKEMVLASYGIDISKLFA